jgi:uncharacterized membrane protein
MLRQPSDLNFGPAPTDSPPLSSEVNYLEEQRKNGIHLETLKSLRQDRRERRRYAEQIFTLISTWLFTVLFILIINTKAGLRLSDSVIITLITTTTASVLGLFVIVINYLFKGNK